MPVLERLKQYIEQKQLLKWEDKVLLAVSGGKDSMLLARLFHDLGVTCLVAHCNFGLRGNESDLDEKLVREYCEELKIPFFVKRFPTEGFAKENKISIQMAARELRYTWFEELRQEQHCNYIAIAQHANDHLETMLLNLTRSTGIQGLLGIQPKRDTLIRPLLFLTAEEIATAVQELQVPFRDDQSNFSTKYARNKIRLEIIPKFKEIQADFESILVKNIQHFEESQDFILRHVDQLRNELFQKEGSSIVIQKSALLTYINDHYLLFELFKPYGYSRNVMEDLASAFDHSMGQIFESGTHQILLDRDSLILQEKNQVPLMPELLHDEMSTITWLSKSFYMSTADGAVHVADGTAVQVDGDKLIFPLTWRSWQQGDKFKPLGMQGSKKVSDYFIQEKLSRFEKETVPILVNGNGELIWIVGMRLDNRFKVTENTKKVLTLVYNSNIWRNKSYFRRNNT